MVKLLRGFAKIWSWIVGVFILVASLLTIFFAIIDSKTFSEFWEKFTTVFHLFNVYNYIVVVVLFIPVVIANLVANKLEAED